MDATETVYTVPHLFRILCYMGGMSMFMATVFWLWRRAYGRVNAYESLRRINLVWFVRIIAALALFSVAFTVLSGKFAMGPAYFLPELSLLVLIFALYIVSTRRRPLEWREIFIRRLPAEILKITGVVALTLLAWAVSLGLGWGMLRGVEMAGGPLWVPAMTVIALWLVLLVGLYKKAPQEEGGIRLGHVFLALVPVCLVIMLPDFIEHLAENPKIDELINAPPRPQKA